MSIISVPARFDGHQVKLLEPAPAQQSYRVLVTFWAPDADAEPPIGSAAWWATVGTWEDVRPVEATLEDIYGSRHSRREPPPL